MTSSTLTIANKVYAAPVLNCVNAPVLVTGTAGFIGFHTAKALLDMGIDVVGVDNMNDYYDQSIKRARTDILKAYPHFTFYQEDIGHLEAMQDIFSRHHVTHAVHLAAQAGVRYSLTHPFSYLKSNIDGFLVLLECARHQKGFQHMAYASSSSVYGMNRNMPFSEADPVEHPMSLYAVTKRANELMAQSYYHLYDIPLTGMRFFTVYGPFGRPDMAAFKFLRAMSEGEPIDVYNHGEMARDYTFVGDTVRGILGALNKSPVPPSKSDIKDLTLPQLKHPVYNLGNNKLESLMHFIALLEKHTHITAIKNMMPLQAGDVPKTAANIDAAVNDFGYAPNTSLDEGLALFVAWYKDFYQKPY